jgi:hypothetical protein
MSIGTNVNISMAQRRKVFFVIETLFVVHVTTFFFLLKSTAFSSLQNLIFITMFFLIYFATKYIMSIRIEYDNIGHFLGEPNFATYFMILSFSVKVEESQIHRLCNLLRWKEK